MNNRHLPIIRLEVEGMKLSIVQCLTEHAALMDKDITEAVERYCTPENIQRVVQSAATQALDGAIKEEVATFFKYGDGRKAVAAAVREAILSNKIDAVLDQ